MKCFGFQVVLILGLGTLAGFAHMQLADEQVEEIQRYLEKPVEPQVEQYGEFDPPPEDLSMTQWGGEVTAQMVVDAARRGELDKQMAIWIDARSREDYLEGHIPGAVHIPPGAFSGGDLPEDMGYWAFEQPLLIYCRGGDCEDSHTVQFRMEGERFTVFHIITDGYDALIEAGLGSVSGSEPWGDGG